MVLILYERVNASYFVKKQEQEADVNSRSQYKTKQKEILLNYVSSLQGIHFTAGDVCEYMMTQGEAIGKATVYRRLESLVDEGVLNKYTVDGNSPACFEYVGEESHGGEQTCYHCKCETCGKLIHLHCDEMKEIQEHLFKSHHFQMDPKRTVFYGLCDSCGERRAQSLH